jgi:hypothetical protein
MKYRIKGSIHYQFRSFRYVKIDGVYEGEAEDQAIDLAVDEAMPYDDGDLHDYDPDVQVTPVEEEAEDEGELNYRLMRSLGSSVAPTLFSEEQLTAV